MKQTDQDIVFRNHDNFGGLRKLLNGFCDPRKRMEEDDNEPGVTSTEDISINARSQSTIAHPSPNESERKFPSVSGTSLDPNADIEIYQKDGKIKDAQREDLPEPCPVQDSSSRSARRIQVVLFAFAAVILTIYALSSLGFTMDFTVMESQRTTSEPKKLINIEMGPKKIDTETADEKALKSLKRLKELVAEIKAM